MPFPWVRFYESQRPRFEEAREIAAVHLRHLLYKYKLVHPTEVPTRVSARVKELSALIRKVRRKERRERIKIQSLRSLQARVDDLVGARVVCDYLDDIAFLLGKLSRHHAFRLLPRKREDYIAKPKNGYRGYHLIVALDTGFGRTKCEIQLQTALQHAWAAKTHTLVYKLRVRDLERIPPQVRELIVQQSNLLYNVDVMAKELRRAVNRYVRRAR